MERGKIDLGFGYYALVDAIFLPLLSKFSWHKSASDYAIGTIFSEKVIMHRFIMGACDGEIVDHINGDKLDNRVSNLRIVDSSKNTQNKRVSRTKTAFKGVDYLHGQYRARIKYKGKFYHLGIFSNPIEAALAYDKKAIEFYGNDAATNYIMMKKYILLVEGDNG